MRKCSFSNFLPRTGLEPNVHSSTLVSKQAAKNVSCFKRGKRSLLYISSFNLDDSYHRGPCHLGTPTSFMTVWESGRRIFTCFQIMSMICGLWFILCFFALGAIYYSPLCFPRSHLCHYSSQ